MIRFPIFLLLFSLLLPSAAAATAPSFVAARPQRLGVNPDHLVLTHVNGDSHADIVAASTIGNVEGIAVALGDGNGNFAEAVRVSRVPQAYVHVDDFDKDGRADLVSSGLQGNVYFYRGNGDGTFAAPTIIAALAKPTASAARDFTGDGTLDLAVFDNDAGTLSLFTGSGNGTFTPAGSYPAGTPHPGEQIVPAASMTAADFNSDGRPDVAVSSYAAGTIRIFLSSGTAFREHGPIVPLAQVRALASADVDGDGRIDLLAGTPASSSLTILTGRGDGSFVSGALQLPAAFGDEVSVADVNGDGRPDLAVTMSINSTLWTSVLLADGNSFREAARYPGFRAPVRFADLDRDGHVDLASPVGGVLAIADGNGDGTFAAATGLSLPGTTPDRAQNHAIEVADFNRDGHLDLAASNWQAQSISVFLGNGDGTFQQRSDYAGVGAELAVARVNDDAAPDLIMTMTTGFGVALNRGDGTFAEVVAYPEATRIFPQDIATADLNDDGFADVVLASTTGTEHSVVTWLSSRNGSFAAGPAFPFAPSSFGYPTALEARDFDGDGRPDVALGTQSSAESVWTLKGADDATLTSLGRARAGAVVRMAAGDLNRDRALDLVTANNSRVTSLLGDGAGGFSTQFSVAGSFYARTVTVADTNFDAQPDVLIGDSSLQAVTVLTGDGTGALEAAGSFASIRGLNSVAAGDFNGDRKIDFAVASNLDNAIAIVLNDTGRGEGCAGVVPSFARRRHPGQEEDRPVPQFGRRKCR